ncbi:MAG: hypothetical protein ACI9DJ_002037 [Algoriphagus sp.]|jgi:hypothetical protein
MKKIGQKQEMDSQWGTYVAGHIFTSILIKGIKPLLPYFRNYQTPYV